MKVLLDTHTLVWALTDSDKLSPAARQAIAGSKILVSIANLWEMILKKSKNDALLKDPLPWWNRHVVGSSIQVLPILSTHVAIVDSLPDLHKDPFDRILLAQAISEKARFVSRDGSLSGYGVPIVW